MMKITNSNPITYLSESSTAEKKIVHPDLNSVTLNETSSSSNDKLDGDFLIELQAEKKTLCHSITGIVKRISDKYPLSCTGFQMAHDFIMKSKNPKGKQQSGITKARADQYFQTAKNKYMNRTLFELGQFQSEHINRTSAGLLLGPVEMNTEQLTECLLKCRSSGFANCDIQALELALDLKFKLGLSDITIYSNKAKSHNYVFIHPCALFEKGAIVDTWNGYGLQEKSFRVSLDYRHFESNISKNENMHQWLDEYGPKFLEETS